MGKLGLYLLILLFFHYITFLAESTVISNPRSSNFIKASCKITLYPAICVHCLSRYANKIQQSERQMAETALSVTLLRARSTGIFISKLAKVSGLKPRVRQALKDCTDNMGDSVDQLRQSVRELGRMGRVNRQDFMWHASNVQTWVSAALTDENTCIDGFAFHNMDGKVKAAIKYRVNYIARVTSNSLALVNRYASKHRGGGRSRVP